MEDNQQLFKCQIQSNWNLCLLNAILCGDKFILCTIESRQYHNLMTKWKYLILHSFIIAHIDFIFC